jgi:hypothetical protein
VEWQDSVWKYPELHLEFARHENPPGYLSHLGQVGAGDSIHEE